MPKIKALFFIITISLLVMLGFFYKDKILNFIFKQFQDKGGEIRYYTPKKLNSLPRLLDDWPIEEENLIGNFYADLPSPAAKQYMVTYRSTKGFEETLNIYRDFLKKRGLYFTEEETTIPNTTMTSKVLRYGSVLNKNGQATIIIRKDEQGSSVFVDLIFITYGKEP